MAMGNERQDRDDHSAPPAPLPTGPCTGSLADRELMRHQRRACRRWRWWALVYIVFSLLFLAGLALFVARLLALRNERLDHELWMAAHNGDAGAVRRHLRARPLSPAEASRLMEDLFQEWYRGRAPAPTAEVARLLLRQGADPRAGISCWMEGANRADDVALLKVLLAGGADPDGVSCNRFPVHGMPLAISVLLRAYDGTEKRFDPGETVLPSMLEALLRAGADPNRPSLRTWTPLMFAAKQSDGDSTLALLLAGADPNAAIGEAAIPAYTLREDLGRQAIHYSAHAGPISLGARVVPPSRSVPKDPDPRALRYLLLFGADPNARSAKGNTPLHVAGFRTAVHVLVAAGADLEARNDEGLTPLMMPAACLPGLLEAGVRLDVRAPDGTPVLAGKAPADRLLILREWVRRIAAARGNARAALLQAASAHVLFAEGWTWQDALLLGAVLEKDATMAAFLVEEAGANPDRLLGPDDYGREVRFVMPMGAKGTLLGGAAWRDPDLFEAIWRARATAGAGGEEPPVFRVTPEARPWSLLRHLTHTIAPMTDRRRAMIARLQTLGIEPDSAVHAALGDVAGLKSYLQQHPDALRARAVLRVAEAPQDGDQQEDAEGRAESKGALTWSALHLAAAQGHETMVTFLLQADLDPLGGSCGVADPWFAWELAVDPDPSAEALRLHRARPAVVLKANGGASRPGLETLPRGITPLEVTLFGGDYPAVLERLLAAAGDRCTPDRRRALAELAAELGRVRSVLVLRGLPAKSIPPAASAPADAILKVRPEGPDLERPDPELLKPGRPEPGRPEPDRLEPDRPEPGKPEPGKPDPIPQD